MMRMRGCAAACSNRIGSRKIWLMRCGGSGVGQLQSGPSVAVKRSRRQGIVNPRQLLPGKRGAVADVVRIIRRQSGIADLFGDAEPAENLHGAGGDVIAFRLRRRGAARASPRPSRRCRATPDRSRASARPVRRRRSGHRDHSCRARPRLRGASTGLHPGSFELGAGILDDHGPALDFGLDVSGKTVRRRCRQRLQRKRRQLLPRRGIGHQLCRSARPAHRRSAAACRPAPPRPARRPAHSRAARPSASVGISGAAATRFGVVTPSTLTLPSLDLLQRRLQVHHHERNMPRDHVEHRRHAAAIGHVADVDAGRRLQHLGAEMLRAAVAGRAIGQTRIGFGVGDELGERLGRDRRD